MENVDIYNKARKYIGKTTDRDNLKEGEYRISVHIWILIQKKILIQKRTSNKKIFPNLWEQTGGGVLAGENSIDAAKRETREELKINISDSELTYVGSYTRINDIVDIWLVEKDIDIKNIVMQKEEVQEVRLVSLQELDKMIERKEVVPTINPSYYLIKNYLNTYKKGKVNRE